MKLTLHKPKALIALASTIALALTACSGGGNEKTADGEIQLTFWHSSSGASADVVDELVSNFNTEYSGKIKVTAVYQGAYADAIAKLANSVQVGNLPDLMQVNDANTTYMRDSGVTIPADQLNEAAEEKTDLSELLPVARSYYTMDDSLNSMPFLVSAPAVFINPELATEAGLDIENPPSNRQELIDWAKTFHEKLGKPGISFHIHPWWFEQWSASNGLLYCAPENGIGSEPATKFTLADPLQIETWRDFAELYASGVALNVGSDGNNAQSAFANGEVGMITASTAGLGNIEQNATFTPVAAPFPIDQSADGGMIIGGNSVWVFGEDPADPKAQAAWTFESYLISKDAQKLIFEKSGYLPINESALDEVASSTDPTRKVLLDQVASTKANVYTAGCHSGAIQQLRNELKEAMTQILQEGKDPAPLLSDLETKSETMVADYNERAGRQ